MITATERFSNVTDDEVNARLSIAADEDKDDFWDADLEVLREVFPKIHSSPPNGQATLTADDPLAEPTVSAISEDTKNSLLGRIGNDLGDNWHDQAIEDHRNTLISEMLDDFTRRKGREPSQGEIRWIIEHELPQRNGQGDETSNGTGTKASRPGSTTNTTDCNSSNHDARKPTVKDRFSIRSVCSETFASTDYQREFLIDKILVRGEPCVIGAALKVMKTSVAVDMAISLSTGHPFLGHFFAKRAAVGVISLESGPTTIKDLARRICESKGRLLSRAGIEWCFRMASLSDPFARDALRDWITEHALEVVIVDPVYLALLDASTSHAASNLLVMGIALRNLMDALAETGVTVVLVHHISKSAARASLATKQPPELSDLTMSGFAEFARQWLMLGRREPYDPETGHHQLWLNAGGSAGHSGLYALDIDEGTPDSLDERHWDVSVTSAKEARAEAAERQIVGAEQQADQKAARKLAANKKRLLEVIQSFPNGETARVIRDAAGLSGQTAGPAMLELITEGLLESCKVTKNHRDEDGYRPVGHGGT